ncbi:MAG TPA: HAD family phosphatase [Acidisarcina sp.]|nr:HAD family phosphatase [Acidisarcina sp.]
MRPEIQLRPAGLIFDMDGVLIDSEPLHKRAKEQVFAEFGIVLPEQVYEDYKGRPDETMMREIAAKLANPAINADELLRRKHRAFEAMEHTILPIPGAVEFVLWAKLRYRIAVATSATPRNREVALHALGLTSAFEAVVDAGDYQHPKPDPEVFQVTARELALRPEQCWVIEDTLNGVKGAKAAGCVAVGLTTTFAGEALVAAGADLIVHSFAELKSRLKETDAKGR